MRLAVEEEPFFTPDLVRLFERAVEENGGMEQPDCRNLVVFTRSRW